MVFKIEYLIKDKENYLHRKDFDYEIGAISECTLLGLMNHCYEEARERCSQRNEIFVDILEIKHINQKN